MGSEIWKEDEKKTKRRRQIIPSGSFVRPCVATPSSGRLAIAVGLALPQRGPVPPPFFKATSCGVSFRRARGALRCYAQNFEPTSCHRVSSREGKKNKKNNNNKRKEKKTKQGNKIHGSRAVSAENGPNTINNTNATPATNP
ncbi:uncharacterized protein LOC143154332 [Ptiloglossa arizonensis]|uniref:uncharacterized protein LOC143154332 n=1 Tax=Ptiloglossa arizonensis TaxID=3350558 RepID=UPI003FA141C4